MDRREIFDRLEELAEYDPIAAKAVEKRKSHTPLAQCLIEAAEQWSAEVSRLRQLVTLEEH